MILQTHRMVLSEHTTRFFPSLLATFFFWGHKNIVQLAITCSHSLTVRQRELKTPSLLTAASFPWAAPLPPQLWPPLSALLLPYVLIRGLRAELSECQGHHQSTQPWLGPVALSNCVPCLCGAGEGKGVQKWKFPSSSNELFTTVGEEIHRGFVVWRSSSRAQI